MKEFRQLVGYDGNPEGMRVFIVFEFISGDAERFERIKSSAFVVGKNLYWC